MDTKDNEMQTAGEKKSDRRSFWTSEIWSCKCWIMNYWNRMTMIREKTRVCREGGNEKQDNGIWLADVLLPSSWCQARPSLDSPACSLLIFSLYALIKLVVYIDFLKAFYKILNFYLEKDENNNSRYRPVGGIQSESWYD